MMVFFRISTLIVAIFLLITTNLCGQTATSTLWHDYVDAKNNNTEPILPDFSHVGYDHGDSPIPDVDFPVFNVVDYGAIANDSLSDRIAIEATIAAAEANGSGIVFFPPGQFRVNEDSGSIAQIRISSGNIVLRGSGSGENGTELFMKHHLEATDPNKLWSTPCLFLLKPSGSDEYITNIIADARRETFKLEVGSTDKLSIGDQIIIFSNDQSASADYIAPYSSEAGWTKFENGVLVKEYHQIKEISGNTIILHEPIHININSDYQWSIMKFGHFENVGVEDIAFVGNWHEDFIHHKNAIHDGGWSAIQIGRAANAWIRRCRFSNWNNSIKLTQSTTSTISDITLDGKIGHAAITLGNCSHVLVRDIDDKAGHWHGPGVSSASSGNVFLRVKSQAHSSPESHASFPHTTLFDNSESGFLYGRFGGSVSSLPNHLENFILWNYNNIGESIYNYKFWRTGYSKYGRVVMPIIVGFHGVPFSFDEEQLKYHESLGIPVTPASLYEAQFNFRKTGSNATGVIETKEKTNTMLSQNYLNPFNTSTKIEYNVAEPGKVRLIIFSLNGQVIKELVNTYQHQGKYSIMVNMEEVPSGIYFYEMRMNGYHATKKMVKL
jgi:hypothetical protein